jgi:hypothetical protein
MKKVILTSVLSLVLLVAFGSIANAQLAKEGTFSIREYASSQEADVQVLAMGEERLHVIYGATGILVNDAGKGFLHNAGSHWLGQLHAVRGVKELETGFAVYTDADGDKVYLTFDWKGIAFKSSHGPGTFVGGTGKYTGITGGCQMTWHPTPQGKKGVYWGALTLKGHWKLP